MENLIETVATGNGTRRVNSFRHRAGAVRTLTQVLLRRRLVRQQLRSVILHLFIASALGGPQDAPHS